MERSSVSRARIQIQAVRLQTLDLLTYTNEQSPNVSTAGSQEERERVLMLTEGILKIIAEKIKF